MTYYGARELAESFRTVRGNTIRIAEDIPEEKYDFRPSPEVRTVGKLLTHIALARRIPHRIHAVERRASLEGFNFPALHDALGAEEAEARSKAEVVSLLAAEGEAWAAFLEGLSEDFLAETVRLPPGATPAARSRFDMILSVKEHEMHHRGQLMLIERMLGIVPHLTREIEERLARARARARTPG